MVAGIALAAWSLQSAPVDFTDPTVSPTASTWASLLSLAAILLVGFGALACLPLIFTAFDAISSRLPIGARLAFGDARRHRGRSWPAAAAVLVATMAVSLLAVSIASQDSNMREDSAVLSAPGHLLAAPQAPVSDAFDAKVLDLGAELVGEHEPILARYRVHAWDFSDPQPSAIATQSCPPGQYPMLASRLTRTEPFTCSPRLQDPGYSIPWWLGGQTFVLDAEAIRSSGLPNAEHAADVLAAGGVVVNASYLIDADDQVRVAVGSRDQSTGEIRPQTEISLPGAFIAGFAGDLAMTPETAARLGFGTPRLVGEFWVTEQPLGHGASTGSATWSLTAPAC